MFDFATEWKMARQWLAAQLADSGGGHDFDHSLRVVSNAQKLLAHYPQADRPTVLLAALLHDVGRPAEDRSRGALCHAEVGAELADSYLRSRPEIPSELREKVVAAIRCHRFRGNARPRELAERLLYDADKLDALGAVGLGRAFLFAGKCKARLHNTEDEALTGAPYGREDTAYREYLVKLRGLPDAMQTEFGRELAIRRRDYMTAFFRQLQAEIDGATADDDPDDGENDGC